MSKEDHLKKITDALQAMYDDESLGEEDIQSVLDDTEDKLDELRRQLVADTQ